MAKVQQIVIIGGGRWSRVLAQTLHKLASQGTHITLHSEHCVAEVREWLREKNLSESIGASAEMPPICTAASTAVIVANAARDHEAAARFALNSGAPVLVEKPLALDRNSAENLVHLARRTSGRLAAANVFLFASYIKSFATRLSSKGEKIRSIQVRWVDPRGELRYGEVKTYDAGLPIYKDVLPHVSAILGTLFPGATQTCGSLCFLRGGATVQIEIELDWIPCKILLVRNGDKRERSISVDFQTESIKLDFAIEPGVITDSEGSWNADPDWQLRPRPLAVMLRAFLRWSEDLTFDARLSVEPALRACGLIDQVSSLYNAELISWLTNHVGSLSESESLRYAADEILQSDGRLEKDILAQYRSRLLREDPDWIARMIMSNQRRIFLRRALNAPSDTEVGSQWR